MIHEGTLKTKHFEAALITNLDQKDLSCNSVINYVQQSTDTWARSISFISNTYRTFGIDLHGLYSFIILYLNHNFWLFNYIYDMWIITSYFETIRLLIVFIFTYYTHMVWYIILHLNGITLFNIRLIICHYYDIVHSNCIISYYETNEWWLH